LQVKLFYIVFHPVILLDASVIDLK
jgi:hypothetical protein